MTERPLHNTTPRRNGFTVIELIVSMVIIGLLIGLLIVGMRAARSTAGGAIDQSLVNQAGAGVEEFRKVTGFLPPLVKDRGNPAPNPSAYTRAVNGRNFANVYQLSVPADAAVLSTLPDSASLANYDANPFQEDHRYSEVSLAYFVVGALEYPYAGAAGMVMDGVSGPGMYEPQRDGGFEVPRETRDSNGQKRVGKPLESFVNLDSGGAKLSIDAVEPRLAKLTDRNGIPLRYYRWLNNATVSGLGDLRVPRMVGRISLDTSSPVAGQTSFPTPADRDIRQNPQLRSATWAIVGAGPNKLFGDEPLAQLAQALGRAPDPNEEQRLRAEAERDNVVRFGSER